MTEALRLVMERHRYDDPIAQLLIEEVQAEYVVRYGGRDRTPVDPAEFAEPHGAFLVLLLEDEPVACVGLRRHDDTQVEVKRMFVREQFRRRGISRQLMAAAEDEAGRLGYRRIILETGSAQPEAVALYRSSGYEEIPGFGYYAGSPLNLCFAKDLTPR